MDANERQRTLSSYAEALEWGLPNREHIKDETIRAFLDMMVKRISEEEKNEPDLNPEKPEPEGQRSLVVP